MMRNLGCICLLLGCAVGARANPKDLSVHSGEAAASSSGNTLQITTSNRAVLDWGSFSISQGEVTRFVQPSEKSAVLNRVLGKETSQLMGLLQSNGQVYLINPNGVVIGKEGRVDTAGFVAASIEIRPEEFIRGQEMHLLGDSSASIVNLGSIQTNGGPVALLGHRVENAGSIEAPGSIASLISGHEILLHPSGAADLYIRPDIFSEGIDQTGAISALEVRLQSDGHTPMAINLGGQVQANSLVEEGGKVYLRAPEGSAQIAGKVEAFGGSVDAVANDQLLVAGSIDTSGEKGGDIFLFANKIDLESGSISATGKTASGEILIGQREKGNITKGANARSIDVQSGFAIQADTLESGDGGHIVILSDGSLQFHGAISAQALGSGGNGGTAELSGREQISCSGLADLRANNGNFGVLVHDPLNITIQAGPNVPPSGNVYNDSYISAQLGLVSTYSISTAPDAGVITFDSSSPINISWSEKSTFQLLGKSITTSGGSTITIQNSYTCPMSPPPCTTFAAIDFRANSGGGIPQSSGTFTGITLTNTDIDVSLGSGVGTISLQGQGGTTASGCTAIILDSTSLTTDSGIISVSGVFFTNVGAIAPSNVVLQNGTSLAAPTGNIVIRSQQGNVTVDATSSITSNSGDITINAGNYFSGAGHAITSSTGTVVLRVQKLSNPPPTTAASVPDVSSIIALAASQSGLYPLSLSLQSLTTSILFGAGNKTPRVGCATAPVAISVTP